MSQRRLRRRVRMWRASRRGPVDVGFAEAREVTREHAKSFFFSSYGLPNAKREAAYAIYAFCRYADDAVDDCAGDVAEARRQLDKVRRVLDAVYAGTADTDEELWLALSQTVQRYQIPRSDFEVLVRGVEMDLEPASYDTWAELEDYCFHVAGIVGWIMTRVFGTVPDVTIAEALGPAAHLGTAMQLTNILRDVAEDWRIGRLYLPREDLDRFGVGDELIARGWASPAFRELMRFEIARARHYYALAEEGMPMLTDDGSRLTALAMSRIYGAILDEIERVDAAILDHRASTNRLTKLRWLWRSYLTVRRLRDAA